MTKFKIHNLFLSSVVMIKMAFKPFEITGNLQNLMHCSNCQITNIQIEMLEVINLRATVTKWNFNWSLRTSDKCSFLIAIKFKAMWLVRIGDYFP